MFVMLGNKKNRRERMLGTRAFIASYLITFIKNKT